jgi:actin-related protein
MEKMWEFCYGQLGVDSKAHPMLLADTAMHASMQSQREKHVEMLFESLEVPVLYLARSAVLSA